MVAVSELHPEVGPQLAGLRLDPARPLLITDADEVLFQFMRGFETYLGDQGCYFDWVSYALTGNIRRRRDNEPIAAEGVRELLASFFAGHTELLEPVRGAADSLRRLSRIMQIVVLSNLPMAQAAARRRALAAHGMDYPLVANIGLKGAAVRSLAEQISAPVFFVDDIPRNHTSVRAAADQVMCIHYVADPRLAKLLGPAEDCHCTPASWAEIEAFVASRL